MIAGDQAAGLWAAITLILQEEAGDWDLTGPQPIAPETLLGQDLGIDSLGLVRILARIEAHLGKRSLPFEKLLVRDGRYVDDLSMAELMNFVASDGA